LGLEEVRLLENREIEKHDVVYFKFQIAGCECEVLDT